MARQRGPVRFQGTIGDLTYKRTRHGYLVQEKSSLDAERVRTDPMFKRARENSADFTTSARAAKLVLDSVKTVIERPGDYTMYIRLFTLARKVAKSDQVNPRGQKTIADGVISMFEGYEYNKKTSLEGVFPVPLTTSIDRVTGDLEVTVASYVPENKFKVPEGTTHYKLYAIGAALDFAALSHTTASAESGFLPVASPTATAPLTLTCSLPANSTLPLFLSFGVAFYLLDSAIYYPLNNGVENTLTLLKVDA